MPQAPNPDLAVRLDAHLADLDALHAALVCGGVVVDGVVRRTALDESRTLRDRAAALVADAKAALKPPA